jgi:hypothetical protein
MKWNFFANESYLDSEKYSQFYIVIQFLFNTNMFWITIELLSGYVDMGKVVFKTLMINYIDITILPLLGTLY